MTMLHSALRSVAFVGILTALPASAQDMRSVDAAMEDCGNNSDAVARVLGCSEVIANPAATAQDLSGAYWHRAYVRCRMGMAPTAEIIGDLMAGARADPQEWKQRYEVSYDGPDAGLYPIVYSTVRPWVDGECFN